MVHNPLIFTVFLQAFIILLCIGLIYYLFTFYKIYTSKKHLESTFDSIDDPLAYIDNTYTLRRVNRQYSALLGQPYNTVLGKKCFALLRGRTSPCEDCRLVAVLTTTEKYVVQQSPHPKKNAGAKISISFYPFDNNKEQGPGIIEHIRDITELENLKNNLEHHNMLLSETTSVLQRAQKEMHNELNLARLIQQRIMPQQAPDFPGLTIAHTYHPIEEVGGDIYDFIKISPDELGIFIGDVSGHGLSSAFISTISKTLLYQHSKGTIPTDLLLKNINNDLIGNIGRSHYLTCFWGIFDNRDNSFTYSRGGHPMPVVLRANGDSMQLSAVGTFLGLLDQPFFEPKKIFLQNGDRCILFTDGIYEVTEVIENNLMVLGYKRFQEIIASTRNLPIEAVIPYIQKHFAEYTHADDYTLIVFDVVNTAPRNIIQNYPGFCFSDTISFFTFSTMTEIDSHRVVRTWHSQK